MPLSVEAQSLLRRVRARVDTDWIQDQYGCSIMGPDGKRRQLGCLRGLIRLEAGGHAGGISPIDPNYGAAQEVMFAVTAQIGRESENRRRNIEGWNDEAGRTPEDVKRLIDRTLDGRPAPVNR